MVRVVLVDGKLPEQVYPTALAFSVLGRKVVVLPNFGDGNDLDRPEGLGLEREAGEDEETGQASNGICRNDKNKFVFLRRENSRLGTRVNSGLG